MKFKSSFILMLFSACLNLQAQKYENLAQTPPMGWNSWNKFNCDMAPEIERKDYSFSFIYNFRDIWQKKQVGNTSQLFKAVIPPHDVVVLRLLKTN